MWSAAHASSVLGIFLSPMAECTMSNNASTWSVTSTKEKRLEVCWRFPINFYGLSDAVITAFGCNSSGDAFRKFLCSAQHHCLCSRSWHLFWHMFLQKQILKTDHISIYLSIYYVPKGAHARGYALQLKIKHCWKLFLFEMLCTCMNEWIYSTDNFSNQAVVDFKVQWSHTEKALRNDCQKRASMYRVIFVTLLTNKLQAHEETITDLNAENIILYG